MRRLFRFGLSLAIKTTTKGTVNLCGGFCLSAGDEEIWAGVVDDLGD